MTAMTQTLRGKVAIVTGAARGIGAATVRSLAREGAMVIATDVLDDEGEILARAVCTDGGSVRYEHLDVTDESQWQALVERTADERGRVDILVNNAGIRSMADVEQETTEGWDRTIAINQKGVWLGMKAAIPKMKDAGGGSVVNVSSIFGAVGGFGASVAYHASKGAVRLMTKNAAIRYAKEGIRVNSIHPGFIDTPLVASLKGTPTETAIIDSTPMGRWGRPEEVGGVIAFLATDAASYMTGSEIYVDGGWTAR
jgi:Dehydrogenases with different specificities (related to short-chain alcohol dehydrogenases)